MRRLLLLTAAAGIALSACGSSTSSKAAETTAAKATETTSAAAAATTAAAAATTAKAATATTAAGATTTKATTAATTAAAGTTAAAAAGSTVAVSLKEWSIESAAVKAGAVSFAVKNAGENPHELLIIKGDSYDSLPKGQGGSVDEAKLGADAVVAKTARIDGGGTATLAANLAAGKYVFVCNLGFGAQSHAGKGQHLDVTVS